VETSGETSASLLQQACRPKLFFNYGMLRHDNNFMQIIHAGEKCKETLHIPANHMEQADIMCISLTVKFFYTLRQLQHNSL
jgi:hypothetical protein